MAEHRALPLSRRSLLAAGVALVAGPSWPAHAAGASRDAAMAFLDGLYDAYRKDGPGVDISDGAALARYFTPELAALIAADAARAAADGEVPNLEADPFIDAQDGEIRDIAVALSDGPGGGLTGHVTFTNSGEPKAIELVLVETAAGWRIDDIHWPEGTLRGLYSG